MMQVVDRKKYLQEVKEIIKEYSIRLWRDLSFQNIDDELKNPARKHTAPEGELHAAVDNGEDLGMVAYLRHSDVRCGMKRLYVHPKARGMHLGAILVEEIIDRTRKARYREIVFDTIEPLKAAISLYKKYSFEECEPYNDTPMNDVICMHKYL